MTVVRAETNLTLLLEQRVNAVEGPREGRIVSVTAQHIRTARRMRISGRLFADCTGDATVGFLAGADFEVSDEGNMGASNLWNLMDQSNTQQVLKCECKDKDALTLAVQAGNVAAPFPRCPWAIDLTDKPFPGRSGYTAPSGAARIRSANSAAGSGRAGSTRIPSGHRAHPRPQYARDVWRVGRAEERGRSCIPTTACSGRPSSRASASRAGCWATCG
jgi:hypothetical protein